MHGLLISIFRSIDHHRQVAHTHTHFGTPFKLSAAGRNGGGGGGARESSNSKLFVQLCPKLLRKLTSGLVRRQWRQTNTALQLVQSQTGA